MSVDSNLIFEDGINIFDLAQYISDTYGIDTVTRVRNDHYATVDFADTNGDVRMLSFFIYPFDDTDKKAYPVPIKGKKTVAISLGYWGNSVGILQGIAKKFGGGYIKEKDTDDSPWVFCS